MIIIGIDPGAAITGYGIVKKDKDCLKCLEYGCIRTESTISQGERLKKINSELNKLIKKHRPEVMAIENVYFFKNLKTAMPVSQSKGVVLFTAAKKKIPVYEFTPPQVKMTVTGFGRASKKQMQEMVKVIFKLEKIPKPDDAADALGIAICCANALNYENNIGRG